MIILYSSEMARFYCSLSVRHIASAVFFVQDKLELAMAGRGRSP